MIGIFGWSVFSTFQSITYLGWEYYFQQRKSDLFWTIIFIGFIIYRILHLKNVLSTSAEIFANGFYLQHGKKQYAYAFTDIAHLQKAFFRGGNNQINSIRLTFYLNSGEVVTIQES
ncbi:MAG: hypothetical protein LBU27_02020 [Candidatus Peribacteria bacterium]|nr:hypothetical protein [Candidatus Peribacteria bacterium]